MEKKYYSISRNSRIFPRISEKTENGNDCVPRHSPLLLRANEAEERFLFEKKKTWQARDDSGSKQQAAHFPYLKHMTRFVFVIQFGWVDESKPFVYVIAGIIIYLNIYAFHAALDQ